MVPRQSESVCRDVLRCRRRLSPRMALRPRTTSGKVCVMSDDQNSALGETQRIAPLSIPTDTETRRLRLDKLQALLPLLGEDQLDEVLKCTEKLLAIGG